MKTKLKIKVKTIKAVHISQLHPEHYWDGEYSFDGKRVYGRLATDGFLLVQDERGLHKIAPIAFLDWQLSKLGCWKMVNGKREFTPPPHTEYSKKAQAEYAAIPELFLD